MLSWIESFGERLAGMLSRPLGFSLLAAVLCTGLSAIFRVPDPDLFARVAVGNLVEVRGGLPHLDPFAYTPLKPTWFDHEWLSGVIFFTLVDAGGEWLLVLLKIGACALTAALLSAAARIVSERSGPSFVWFLLTFYLIGSVWVSSVRSHIFTYVFLAGVVLAFERYRRQRRWGLLALIPIVMIPWVNSHGGFVAGLGYLGVMTLGAWLTDRKSAVLPSVVLVACLGACLVNPYGVGYLRFILEAVTMPRPYVTEWYPPGRFEVAYYPFFLALGTVAFAAIRSSRKLSAGALVMLAIAGFLGLSHARLVPMFGIFALVYGWPLIEATCARWERSASLGELWHAFGRTFALVLLTFIVPTILVISGHRLVKGGALFDYTPYPRRALDWLWETGATGRLPVDFDRGSFALWRLFPRFQISLDGRYEELYPNSTIALVVAALDPDRPDHHAAFRSIEPTEILVDSDHRGYRESGVFGPGWRIAYQDERFAILSSRSLDAAPPPASSIWERRYRSSLER